MIEVASGIHQIKIPVPFASRITNGYILPGDDGLTLIDTGAVTEDSYQAIVSELKEGGWSIKDIRVIVPTHYHRDHYGQVVNLRAKTGAKVFMHRIDAEMAVRSVADREELNAYTAKLLRTHGMPISLLADAFEDRNNAPATPNDVYRFLEDGEIIELGNDEFQVIWTPGHTSGHICLYSPTRKFIFTGDHLLPKITPHIGLGWDERPNPLGEYIESLRKIAALDAEMALPAHQNIFKDPRHRALQIIGHHELRKMMCLDALASGPKTGYEASLFVFSEELSPFQRRMAMAETLAHLELLVEEGTVEKVTGDSVYLYQLKGRGNIVFAEFLLPR